MVFIMVIMIVIVLMVYGIGVITRGTSQTKSSEEQIDQIKTEQLALGSYAKAYTDLASGNVMDATLSATLDNKTYAASAASAAGGPNDTNAIVISSPYPN